MDKFKFNNDFNNMNKFKFNNNDLKAFNILGISVVKNGKKFKKNLKNLSKNFTDMNAGNKKFEDKLKVITLAYTQLKNTYKEKLTPNIDPPDIKLSIKQTFELKVIWRSMRFLKQVSMFQKLIKL